MLCSLLVSQCQHASVIMPARWCDSVSSISPARLPWLHFAVVQTLRTTVTVSVAWVCHAIVQIVCTFQAGDDSAYRLLFSSYQGGQPILDRGRTEVFQMSAFEHDQSAEAQKCMIGDIRRAIEQGKTCFLMYTEPIHGSLYDLFNQFFTVQRDRDQNAKLYVQIGIGSYSKVTSNVCICSLHSCLVCKASSGS